MDYHESCLTPACHGVAGLHLCLLLLDDLPVCADPDELLGHLGDGPLTDLLPFKRARSLHPRENGG